MQRLEVNDNTRPFFDQLKHKVAAKIVSTCETGLLLISSKVFPTCTDPVSKAYFSKLQGDLERYVAEVSSGPQRTGSAERAHQHYLFAADMAVYHLSPLHPTRLSLMLNYSIFYYDIYNEPERACIISKAACDDATEHGLFFKDPKEEKEFDLAESRKIYNSIRGNLVLWSSGLRVKHERVD
jgi:14-3-3 protein epsilon